jgi:hypothetical protein
MSLVAIFHSQNVRYIVSFILPLEVEITEEAHSSIVPPIEGRKTGNTVRCRLELELDAVLIHPPVGKTTYSFPLANGGNAVAKGDRVMCSVDRLSTNYTVRCEPMLWENKVFTSREEFERGVRSMIKHGWRSKWSTAREIQTFIPDFKDSTPSLEIKDVAA